MKVKCEKCSSSYDINDRLSGKKGKCIKCGFIFTILAQRDSKKKIYLGNKIKIPKVFQFIALLINFNIFVGLFIITDNLFHIVFLVNIIFAFIFAFVYYKVFSYNKIAITAFIGFFIVLMFGSFFGIYDEVFSYRKTVFLFFYIVSVLILCFGIYELFKLRKNISLGVEKVEKKYLTSKNQGKPFLILNGILIISLILFRVFYYISPDITQKFVDKDGNDFFETKYENIEIKDEDNLYLYIKSFQFKYDFIDEKLLDEISSDIIENSKKKYFKDNDIYNLGGVVDHSKLIGYYRESTFNVLYYLEDNQEDKAIELLNSKLKIGFTIINGDTDVIGTLVGKTLLGISLGNIELILENYTISKESKDLLLSTLSNEIKVGILDNSLKNSFKKSIYSIEQFVDGSINFNNSNIIRGRSSDFVGKKNSVSIFIGTTLFDSNKTINGAKKYYYDTIKTLGNGFLEIPPLNLFKSNQLGNILRNGASTNYGSQYKKIIELESLRKNIVEKLKNIQEKKVFTIE